MEHDDGFELRRIPAVVLQARRGQISVKADKIVSGKRVPMGDVTFRPDPAIRRWVSEIKTPNVNALLYLSLKAGVLSGGMSLVPSGTVVRAIELRRAQGSA